MNISALSTSALLLALVLFLAAGCSKDRSNPVHTGVDSAGKSLQGAEAIGDEDNAAATAHEEDTAETESGDGTTEGEDAEEDLDDVDDTEEIEGSTEEDDEAQISIDLVPAAVVAAIEQAIPGATWIEVEVEMDGEQTIYEVEVEAGGIEYEIEVTADGEILEIEEDTYDDDD